MTPVPHPSYRHDPVWRVCGTPQERLARVAARRAFVEMKQCFIDAAAVATGRHAERLRLEVRQAGDVQTLWQLHQAVMACLPHDALGEQHRNVLREQLDGAFPNAGGDTEFAAL